MLIVVFYETRSLKKNTTAVLSPMHIKNTSFVNIEYRKKHNYIAMLQVRKLTRGVSHQVVMENVSWCQNDLTSYESVTEYSLNPFHAENMPQDESVQNGHLLLKFKNVLMHHNLFSENRSLQRSLNCLMCFVNIEAVSIEETSYFGENAGGTVISVVSSTLSISGNLTIKDGYAVEGGGIHLDASSNLFLREPLDANFINYICSISQLWWRYKPDSECDSNLAKQAIFTQQCNQNRHQTALPK